MVGKWGKVAGKCCHPEHVEISARQRTMLKKLKTCQSDIQIARMCVRQIAGVHSALECDSMRGFSFSIIYNYMSNCQLSVNNEKKRRKEHRPTSRNRCHLVAPQVVLKIIRIFRLALFLTTSLCNTVQRFSPYPFLFMFSFSKMYINKSTHRHRHRFLSIYIRIKQTFG